MYCVVLLNLWSVDGKERWWNWFALPPLAIVA